MPPHERASSRSNIPWIFTSIISLVVIAWLRLRGNGEQIPFWQIALEMAAFGLLSFAFCCIFSASSIKHKTRYRLAFLVAVAVSMVFSLITFIAHFQGWQWGLFVLTIISSFLGNFVAANLQRGWWENNAPPSPEIKAEVLDWHRSTIGPELKSPYGKRFLDIFFALISLLLSTPIWLLVIVLIWWEDPGPVLFVKNAVGKGGKNFKQFKFRSMITDAERDTGPISGYENDERVLFFGKILRKTAMDELPQLINILLGDMSYVGPRPQRTVLVHGYLQRLPEYAQRHRVRPGLAGLAQVVDSYDISPEDKLAWDLVYIEKASIWLDLKLVLSAFYLVFALRWLPGSNPELLIRRRLNIQKPYL